MTHQSEELRWCTTRHVPSAGDVEEGHNRGWVVERIDQEERRVCSGARYGVEVSTDDEIVKSCT